MVRLAGLATDPVDTLSSNACTQGSPALWLLVPVGPCPSTQVLTQALSAVHCPRHCTGARTGSSLLWCLLAATTSHQQQSAPAAAK
jgi:hypothetical protein